jgi:hypothetical protein
MKYERDKQIKIKITAKMFTGPRKQLLSAARLKRSFTSDSATTTSFHIHLKSFTILFDAVEIVKPSLNKP